MRLALLIALIAGVLVGCGGSGGGGDASAPLPLDFLHTAVASSAFNSTEIDHPAANDNPNALLLVTRRTFKGSGPIPIPASHPVGVSYQDGRWAIVTQDLSPIVPGDRFNVSILQPGTDAYAHLVDASNRPLGWVTQLDAGPLNGRLSAVPQTTLNLSPAGASGRFNNSSLVFAYAANRWQIQNMDISEILLFNAAFNVVVSPGTSFTHLADPGNIAGGVTYIDDPATNGDSSAIIHVVRSWAGSSTFVNNPSDIHVRYSGTRGQWGVQYQDGSAVVPGESFNVSRVR